MIGLLKTRRSERPDESAGETAGDSGRCISGIDAGEIDPFFTFVGRISERESIAVANYFQTERFGLGSFDRSDNLGGTFADLAELDIVGPADANLDEMILVFFVLKYCETCVLIGFRRFERHESRSGEVVMLDASSNERNYLFFRHSDGCAFDSEVAGMLGERIELACVAAEGTPFHAELRSREIVGDSEVAESDVLATNHAGTIQFHRNFVALVCDYGPSAVCPLHREQESFASKILYAFG